MIKLSAKWAKELTSKPEAGMGYQIVSIILFNGTRYDRVIVDSGFISRSRDFASIIPFEEKDIKEIIVTNDKWDGL